MMETCHYDTVETVPDGEYSDNTIPRKHLLRQVLICSGIWASYFSTGLCFGSPTVLIAQIRHEANSSDAVSIEMESWLSSAFNYSAMVNSVVLAVLARLIGRRLSFVVVCITALIGHVVFYFSTTIIEILISEIIHGLLLASPITVSIMVLTEYTSPRYRGVFLTLKSASFLWGIWVSNVIGTFLHWKNIGVFAIVCSSYSVLTALLWPESPYWLATKKRFEDCAVSHRWLKGCNRESEKELKKMIQSQSIEKSVPEKTLNIFHKVAKMFKSKLFYKPIILSMLVMPLYQFSGKIACGMYAIGIIKRITGTESTAYIGMLILDGVTVLGMYIGCGFSKILKRRTLLLTSSTIGVIFLFCISLYLYLIDLGIISEVTYISISLLMAYSLAMSVGPMIMSTTILGELIPMKYRSLSVLLLGFYANFLMGNVVKISPFILDYFGARGLFLFFSITESLFIVINYKLLPETKDKTLLEIQENLRRPKRNVKSIDNQNEEG